MGKNWHEKKTIEIILPKQWDINAEIVLCRVMWHAWWNLPKFAFSFLGRNFNDSRLVDDARRSVALLNDANDPGLVSLLLLDVFAESSRLFAWQSNQKSSCKKFKYDWSFLFTKQIKNRPKFWIVIHLPEVSAEWPWIRPNMLPQALLTAAIFAIIGKLWMTNPTSFFCTRAKFWAWPSRPKPVTSVAPCALYLCMSRAA